MTETEIPADVKRIAHEVFCRWNEEDGGHALAERAIMTDRAARAPDPSREMLVEAAVSLRKAFADMGLKADDPMWADHVELAKPTLRWWITLIRAALSAIEASK